MHDLPNVTPGVSLLPDQDYKMAMPTGSYLVHSLPNYLTTCLTVFNDILLTRCISDQSQSTIEIQHPEVRYLS